MSRIIYIADKDGMYLKQGKLGKIRPKNSTFVAPPSQEVGKWLLSGGIWISHEAKKIVVPISITRVLDAISYNEDTMQLVVKELTPFSLKVSVPLGLPTGVLKEFLVPIRRVDTNRTVYVVGKIANDVLSTEVVLPTSGKWVCGEEELNSNIADEPFRFSFRGLSITAVQ